MSNKNSHIAIVISEFNEIVTNGLLRGAKDAFSENNGKKLTVIKVPGAFEIPATTKRVASQLNPDAIVTLGAIIKGETKHFDFISAECSRAIQELTLELDIPIMFGVLTTENADQAIERSTTNNKGYEVMDAAFKMIETFKGIKLSSEK